MESTDNFGMVNRMAEEGHLVTQRMERVFRLVDRNLFLPEDINIARDRILPVRAITLSGQINILSPHIYSMCLEMLQLESGQSFLNIGSGSGYLSTLAGFFLRGEGQNHGIELYPNVIEHAVEAVEKMSALPLSKAYPWTRPRFVQGNGLALEGISQRYDKIFVGGKVLLEYIPRLTSLLTDGGILVVPVKCEDATTGLYRYVKTGDKCESTEFYCCPMASLVVPSREPMRTVNPSLSTDLLGLFTPPSLLSLTLNSVRLLLMTITRLTTPTVVSQAVDASQPFEKYLKDLQDAVPRFRRSLVDRMTTEAGYESSDENVHRPNEDDDSFEYPDPFEGMTEEERDAALEESHRAMRSFLDRPGLMDSMFANLGFHSLVQRRDGVKRLAVMSRAIWGKETITATGWMEEVQMITDLIVSKPSSLDQEFPEILKRPIAPLASGRYSIEDWMLKKKQDEHNHNINGTVKAIEVLGVYQFVMDCSDDLPEECIKKGYFGKEVKCEMDYEMQDSSIRRYIKVFEKRVMDLPIPPNEKAMIMSSYLY